MNRIVTSLYFLLFMTTILHAAVFEGIVKDANSGEPLPFASLTVITDPKQGSKVYGGNTDANGRYRLELPDGKYEVSISYLGYVDTKTDINITASTKRDFTLKPNSYTLSEVVVTAREGERLSSGSKIDRSAMDHLQPSSFTDLLELLPGNVSKDPSLTGANTITLRETGNLGATGSSSVNDDYAVSSLGTLFVVDGAPLSNDAGMQSIGNTSDATSPHYSRNITNKGVDMRTIATDNIESVEIVRGIPGAEYGNLSTGMVNIRRINRATPFNARFKADEYSKLLYAGKGIRFSGYDNVLNIDLGYLDAKNDPREARENYKRLTASARFSMRHATANGPLNWNISADYTGSFDNTKSDPDLSLRKIDEYRSSFSRGAVTTELRWQPQFKLLDMIQLNASTDLQNEILEQRKQVAPTHPAVAPSSMNAGVSDGRFILGEYIADYRSEGKPFNLYGKLSASGNVGNSHIRGEHKAGIEYSMAKNFGRGQIYDLMKPLSASWTTRPRRFSDIPALHNLSIFLQEQLSIEAGKAGSIDFQAGLRLQSLPGLDKAYELAGKMYVDPRLNLLWHIGDGWRVRPFLGGGYGMTTRMPTVDYLYPQEHFADFVQLNYYDVNKPEELSRINLMTYVDNTVNYDLQAARNKKWEIRAGFNIGRNALSLTYFDERLRSGFRYQSVYQPYSYTLYDSSAINPENLTTPPSLTDLPSVEKTVLAGYRTPSNGTRIDKRGLEFQFNSARWDLLKTALTVTGAWFESVYSNSQMLYSPVNDVVDNQAVSDRYVGVYNYDDGRRNSQFNTNFMFDTQITRFGLVFTTTLQCMWFVKTRQLYKEGTPLYYLDAYDGGLHPFTAESAADPMLSKLVKTYNDNLFNTVTIPTALYFNLKATKSIGKWLNVSVFVNRILDYLPDYRVNGLTIRRNSDAYFGMEVNIKI